MGKKKFVIIGPVPDDNGINLGGVAEFTISLADALQEEYNVYIVTNTSSVNETVKGVSIKSVNVQKKYSIFSLVKMFFAVKKIGPDIVLSSLQYSFIPLFIKNAIKIHFVHGFPSKKYYSKVKLWLFNFLDVLINKNFNLKIANSNFTRVINEVMLNNRIDAVIPLAVNDAFLQNEWNSLHRDIDILFVGRITEAKGIFSLINAIKKLPKKCKVCVVGDGDAFIEVQHLIEMYNLNVELRGRLDRNCVRELYLKSKVFISLNTHEPFGITFIEAVASGCKIVCPDTGGQVEEMLDFSKNVFFIKSLDPDEISRKICAALESKESLQYVSDDFKKYYSYKRVADNVRTLLGEINE